MFSLSIFAKTNLCPKQHFSIVSWMVWDISLTKDADIKKLELGQIVIRTDLQALPLTCTHLSNYSDWTADSESEKLNLICLMGAFRQSYPYSDVVRFQIGYYPPISDIFVERYYPFTLDTYMYITAFSLKHRSNHVWLIFPYLTHYLSWDSFRAPTAASETS